MPDWQQLASVFPTTACSLIRLLYSSLTSLGRVSQNIFYKRYWSLEFSQNSGLFRSSDISPESRRSDSLEIFN
jgi:hypothetical protein